MDTTHDIVRETPGYVPVGFIDREGAARIFGKSVGQFNEWMRQGRIACRGRMVPITGGGVARVWPIHELEQAREQMKNPDGWVTTQEALSVLDVSRKTLDRWIKLGIIPSGRIGHASDGKRTNLYPLEELERIKLQRDRALDPVSDPEHPGCFRVPLSSQKHTGMAAIVDEADLSLVRGRRWNWSIGSKRAFDKGKVTHCGTGTVLGRMILGVTDPSVAVCHANGDRLDHRRTNLVLKSLSDVAKDATRVDPFADLPAAYADPDRPGVVRVPICTGLHAGMEAIIDAGDLSLIGGMQWNWSPGRLNSGDEGSVVLRTAGSPKPGLSRIIMGVTDAELLVSHLNGDRLDCRRENLVLRTRQQVKASARKMLARAGRACSSKYKGVCWQEDGAKWTAGICLGGRVRQLGRFISEIDAALAYDAAARESYGEHARLNFTNPMDAELARAEEPLVEPGALPSTGMVTVQNAARMFGIPLVTWAAWMEHGRIPAEGTSHTAPDGESVMLYRTEELNRVQETIRQLVRPYPDPNATPHGPQNWRLPLVSHIQYREAIIDEASVALVADRTWCWQGRFDGTDLGCVVSVSGVEQAVILSRLLTGTLSAGTEARLTHRNDNPLDCRLCNLQVRTSQEQMFGARKMGTVNGRQYSSRFKGVSWDRRSQRWRATITKDRIPQGLGTFRDEMAAAQKYDEAARELFGEHARLNFPDGVDTWLEEYHGVAKAA